MSGAEQLTTCYISDSCCSVDIDLAGVKHGNMAQCLAVQMSLLGLKLALAREEKLGWV